MNKGYQSNQNAAPLQRSCCITSIRGTGASSFDSSNTLNNNLSFLTAINKISTLAVASLNWKSAFSFHPRTVNCKCVQLYISDLFHASSFYFLKQNISLFSRLTSVITIILSSYGRIYEHSNFFETCRWWGIEHTVPILLIPIPITTPVRGRRWGQR